MANASARRVSERRAEHLLNDLLISQGWVLRRPPQGDVLFQGEYRNYPELAEALARASKSGPGSGIPEAIILDRESVQPIAVIEVKSDISEIAQAVSEAQHYANALWDSGSSPLAIGLAGTTDDEFELQVTKRVNGKWEPITYDGNPIGWIPTRVDLERVATPGGPTEIRPTIPPLDVLAARAEEINRLLRESQILDGDRPVIVGAIMLALWNSKGKIRRDPAGILRDINSECEAAFIRAGKADMARSLRVDQANDKLKEKARRIATILERLNVTVLTAEHDYLGQLYETFFRYTGGNTIGQYFTPRHITRMMADVCGVTNHDIVLDPACGSGGFLIACMDRLLREYHLSRPQMITTIQSRLIGFETESKTAALCVANMILRGDGSTGVHRADCFTSPSYPVGEASVALINPPFPHKKTDTPSEDFVNRALEGLHDRGKLAVVLPTGLLAKPGGGTWRQSILKNNSLLAVCQLPNELFQPFAAATTSFILLEKGVPHNAARKTAFVRLHYDGLSLHKGARIERGPNQIPEAISALLNGTSTPGFSGSASISGDMEWSAGAYIPSAVPDEGDLQGAVDILLRRLASFYTRYAPEVLAQRRAIVDSSEIDMIPYRSLLTNAKLENASAITGRPDEIGGQFDMYYGLGEIESREGIAPGRTLIISPTERYNGCYGWLEFGKVLEPPFITVARTGSIGEAFVHLEPCAPNSDCIILLPRHNKWSSIPELIIAASAIRLESWRYNYGRKITPARLATEVKLPNSVSLKTYTADLYQKFKQVIEASLRPYQTPEDIEDQRDAEIARERLSEIEAKPETVLQGAALEKRLNQWQS